MSLACIADNEVTPQWATWLHALAQSGRAYQLHTHLHTRLWVAVERLSCVQTIYPGNVPLLPGFDEPWTVEEAVTEVLRARLGGFGPLSLIEIAAPLALPVADVTQALARLEHEGYVLRGHFSPGATQEQWCERHLLARIHRYTVKRLRREIEPVALQDFMRFLFDWQHLSDGTRGQGSAMLPQIVGQFEGYAAATSAWDSDLLSARLKDYSSTWLDELCRSGKLVWTRLSNKTSAMALRSTPVVLLPRNQVGLWSGLTEPTDATTLSPKAQKVHQALRDHGALFFDELVHEAHLLRSELETALQELVGAGVVNADSFAGLRALTTPASKRQARSSRRGRGAFIGGMDDAGRWALIRRPSTAAGPPSAETLEHVAMTLLRRYGVVFWRLLEREAEWLPSWRELLRTFHRLEARGEIRGGRFVSGLAGEQFALPEAIPLLREVRRRPHDGSLIAVCGADPLNLVGTLLPGTKVPAVSGNRIVYRDGLPAAVMVAGKQQVLVEVDRQAVQERLIRH